MINLDLDTVIMDVRDLLSVKDFFNLEIFYIYIYIYI
jgi:hypothetical protein